MFPQLGNILDPRLTSDMLVRVSIHHKEHRWGMIIFIDTETYVEFTLFTLQRWDWFDH